MESVKKMMQITTVTGRYLPEIRSVPGRCSAISVMMKFCAFTQMPLKNTNGAAHGERTGTASSKAAMSPNRSSHAEISNTKSDVSTETNCTVPYK